MRNKNAVLISALVCTACLGIGAVTVPNVSDSLTSVVQADDAVYEGFLYSVSGGEATITGYSEDLDMSNIVIPDVIMEGDTEIPVTAIGNSAFAKSKAEKITVGKNTKKIGDYAFAYCTNLKELDLGRNVTSLGSCVIGSENWSTSVMHISKLTIPDKIVSMGDNFYGQYSSYLTTVSELIVPDSVTSIQSIFINRTTLANITVSPDNKNYYSDQGVLYTKDKSKLIRCPQSTKLTEYTIDSVTDTVGNSAFYNCSSIGTILVSDSVTKIEDYAFFGCTGLRNLTLGKNVSALGSCVIGSENWSTSVMHISKLTIPDKIVSMGDNFYGQYSSYLTTVSELIVPDSVISIQSTFYNRTSLNNISVSPDNKNYYSDQGVLYTKDKSKLIRCPQSTELKEYTTDSATETIGNSAFYNCSNLENITVSDSVTKIEDYAFFGCIGLRNFILGKNVTDLGSYVIGSANWSSSVMHISRLTIPDNIQSFGDNIFGQYSGYLTTVSELVVPESVSVIYTVFFRPSLKEINVEEGNVKYLSDNGVLYNCEKEVLSKCPESSNILMYDVITGTKSIAASAFINTKVQSVLIPSTVTEIGENAFKGSALKTVRGTKGSYAETFAAEKGYTFEEIAGDPETGVPSVSPSAVPSVKPSEEPSAEPSETPSSAPSEIPSAAPADDRGDVDGDGEVTTTDVRKILQYLVKTLDLSEEQQTAADVNNDGFVNSTDALLLLRRVAGVVTAE